MTFRRRLFVLAYASLVLLSCDRDGQAPAKPDLRPFPEVLASEGLAGAEKHLASQPKSAETDFLLGGVHFLRAIEAIQQIRYANYSGELSWLPGMRTPLPANPDARFDPAFLENAMKAALGHLHQAETALQGAIGENFTAEVQLRDVWFDINANGTHEDWEGVLAMMDQLGARPAAEFDGIIRFDTADADWLTAYVHLISAMAELTLAVDPTPAIKQVSDSREAMQRIAPVTSPGGDPDFDALPETIAATLIAFRGKPEQRRSRAAHAHIKAMIAHALAFWDKVMLETDNDHEWLPNPNQVSAFGVELNAETAKEWQAVLTEVSAIFEGKALIAFWRIRNDPGATTGIGVNIAKMLQDPPDMDLILLVQGTSLVPYLEQGRLANMAAWDRFAQATRGNPLLFAAWLN